MKKLIALFLCLMMVFSLTLTAHADEQMAGGWSISESTAVTPEAEAALAKAMQGFVGSNIQPVALLGTQLVAGMNYCLLCRVTPVTLNPVPGYALVYVYSALDGSAQITDIQNFELGMPLTVEQDDLTPYGYALLGRNLAEIQGDDGEIYDLFDITAVELDDEHNLIAVTGHYGYFEEDDTGDMYIVPHPTEVTYPVSADCQLWMLNDDLDNEFECDFYEWYVLTQLFGEAPAEGQPLPFTRLHTSIELNEAGEVIFIAEEYVPWG